MKKNSATKKIFPANHGRDFFICITTLTAWFVLVTFFTCVYFLAIPRNTNTSPKPVVAATTFPLFDITRNIAGDNATVLQLMPPNSSIHSFELTPFVEEKIQSAKLIISLGLEADGWTKSVAEKYAKKTFIVSSSPGISLHYFNNNLPDPHYALSIKNATTIAQTIARYLISLDPEHKSQYETNEQLYIQKLLAADKIITEELLPFKERKIITEHDAWWYFAHDYNLDIPITFQETAGKNPEDDYLKKVVSEIQTNKIKTIFFEPQLSTELLKKFATQNNVSLASIDPMDGGGTNESSYIAIMLENTKKIIASFQ
jgi:ABC-type Zn uptake system ZnuABC Zn-binding protein ZnuA